MHILFYASTYHDAMKFEYLNFENLIFSRRQKAFEVKRFLIFYFEFSISGKLYFLFKKQIS